jgi:large repetitive protein
MLADVLPLSAEQEDNFARRSWRSLRQVDGVPHAAQVRHGEKTEMPPAPQALGLYDLLAPEFLAGFNFPGYIDQYLSLLSVSGLTMTSDESGVLYTGTVYFPAGTGNPPVTQHADPSGAVFEWSDVSFQFRLRAWREASPDVQTVVNAIASGGNSLQSLFGSFAGTGSGAVGSDYPGLRFRLELLVSVLTFHLGNDWVPGVFDSTYHVIKDTTSQSTDVRIQLPKMLLRYEQGEDFSQAPTFTLDSWGNAGFDAPSDLAEGELVSMDPALAMHTSGRVAFSVQDIVLDLSPNNTPPEILSHFGTGDDFEGVYIKALQFYYSDADKDFAFNIAVRDALISFKGEVWLEAELDLMFDQTGQPSPAGLNVTPKFLNGNLPIQFNASTQAPGQAGTYQGGSVTVPPNVCLQLQVSGGVPPYTYAADFTPSGGPVVHLWDSGQNQAHFATPPASDETGNLVITVTDSTSGTPLTYTNTMAMTVTAGAASLPNGAPEDAPGGGALAPATLALDPRPAGIPDSYQIAFTPATSGDIETLVVQGSPGPVTATVNGNPAPVSPSGQLLVEVAAGASVPVTITYPAQGDLPGEFDLRFSYDGPRTDVAVSSYVAGVPSPDDPVFTGNAVPGGVPPDGSNHTGADALAYWVSNALDTTQPVNIEGRASYEGHDDRAPYNQALSERRLQVAEKLVTGAGGQLGSTTATGQTVAQGAGRVGDPADRVAIVTGTPKQGQPGYTLTGTLARAASPGTGGTTPAPQTTAPPPTPPAASNSSKPPSLKRLSFRVRLEKNVPVLLEISGEIDFQQQAQSALQQAPGSVAGGSLGLQNTPSATANSHAGPTIVDFTLNVTYDTATHNLTETLTLGAAPADKDGLLRMQNTPDGSGSYDTFKNIFGALLTFTPILNAATTAIDPNSAGEWGDLAISLGPPVLIGGLGWINTVSVTLYGGSLVARENVPAGLSSATFTAAALTFDYGVAFRFDIGPLDIHSSRNLSVRYQAVGFGLNFEGSPAFKFVFDTSKGYALDLSDPSLFNLPAPLGDLLKIAEARIAQHNPLTLEVDLVVKADLGVVTVDEFQIKIPFDGSAPMILPSGVHVNIPGAITGGGSVHIQQGGFEGGFDLTLVPISLRVAATVGVEQVTAGARSATAVYLGIEVDFPTPLVLGTTGLGIFGLFGLFGMHYTRNLPPAAPGSAVSPDLQWLLNSGGQPQFLFNQQNPVVQNWVPEIGSWAFGIGALLGTLDGFLLNMRGAFILELPGPQIIITVNLQIVADLPGADGGIDTGSLTAGILGILDIDFNLGQITIGVSINLDVEQLIVITIPISIFFSWNDPDQWHVWIGTIQTPVSADILGIVKGSGYFMIGGEAISPFPPSSSGSLPGVAVAMGIQASVIWGSEDIGIYLKVVLGADLGVSFSPHLFIEGEVHLSGELRLLIVSISASGDFLLQAPTPFYLQVTVCGSVSFFFFSISACVQFSIGGKAPPPPPPPLIGRMYLQSYAPVIPSGQGGSRPIDASLGDATETVASEIPGLKPPAQQSGAGPVPIDTVPVLQFQYAADASGISATFTQPVPQCPMLPTVAGGAAVSLGGGRTAVYQLRQLTINPPLPAADPPPPVVWRKNTSTGDATATRVDLALFSRDPNLASHALERSTTLKGQLTSIWGGTCAPPAPPACVLWTFCDQRLGPAHAGWQLTGIATPDPAGTQRSSPVPTGMQVEGPDLEAGDALFGSLAPLFGASAWEPARVIGVAGPGEENKRTRCWRALELPELLPSPGTGLGAGYFSSPGNLDAELQAISSRIAAQSADSRWVRLHTGGSARVQLFLAIAKAHGAIVIRERDASGTLLRETDLASLGPVIVTSPASLPAEWTDPAGPWRAEVEQVYVFLNNALASLVKVFVEFTPLPTTTVIEVAETGAAVLRPPTCVIAAVGACPSSEQQRYETGLQVQQSQITTLEGYLDGGSPVPLLAPKTTYTITVVYDVTTTEADGTKTSYPTRQQGFTFTTDAAAPAKLDPWVMSSCPANNELNVFYQDPVVIVFNDQEAIQLWNAYGYQLVLGLRAADGLNDPSSSVAATTSVSGIGPAGYDTLLGLIDAGLLPCVGSTTAYQNQQYTADVTLRPSMAYTLDIVTDPAGPAPGAGQPVVPLYRTRFTTSRYASMDALAAGLGGAKVLHRQLTGPLTLTSPAGGAANPVSDADIQSAFLAAGEQALPAPASNAITIYWIPGSGGGPAVPYCLLLDCTEPLWRWRQEPSLVPVDPSDPSFDIVQVTPTAALTVEETGGSNVAGYLYSTSGTRTIVFFSPGFSPAPGGTPVTLALHRPASQVFGIADRVATIIALPIEPQAPWEADHV